jgi:hypothetical protein
VPVAFSPDVKLLASVAAGTRIVIQEVTTGKPLHLFEEDEDIVGTNARGQFDRLVVGGAAW